MPSRPVLIGRGLVPTPYTNTHPHRHNNGCATVRPNAQNTTTQHKLIASTKQFPTNKPTRKLETVCEG